jgi:hypothetical protein
MSDVAELEVAQGGNTFKIKAPPEFVKEQFAEWRNWLGTVPTPKPVTKLEPAPVLAPTPSVDLFPGAEGGGGTPAPTHTNGHVSGLERLYNVDGENLTPTNTPQGDSARVTALFVLLLGYTKIVKMAEVSGRRLTKSLKHTGIPGIKRVDTIADAFIKSAHIVRSGLHRGVTYKLTVTGMAEAERHAKGLLGNMPVIAA